MQLLHYITVLESGSPLPAVSLFSISKEAELFFSLFLQARAVVIPAPQLVTIDVSTRSLREFQALTAISFLGMAQRFWIGNLSVLALTVRQEWLVFLTQYCGPHYIYAYIDAADSTTVKDIPVIAVPVSGDISVASALNNVLCDAAHKTRVERFLPYLFRHTTQWPLETLCVFLMYAPVLSATYGEQFIKRWLPVLAPHDESLFQLSSLFFARNTQFFSMWLRLVDEYQPSFWTAFWSDQFWRSALFVHYAEQNQFATAKKITHRLPFSFTKKDWKNFSYQSLVAAHEALYAADHAIKNGGGAHLIDQVLLKCMYE
ncbi:MAG: hypothetical protein WCE21_04630 [Candidatus Babeliales bacterium]